MGALGYTRSDLADALFQRPSWWAEAACNVEKIEVRGVPTPAVDVFFPRRPGPTAEVRAAKAICAGCSVRVDCLDSALLNAERSGIWGGLTEIERRGLRPGTLVDWRRRAREAG